VLTARRAWWLLLAAGCCASVVTLWLPWRTDDYRLGVPVRVLMVAAGAVLLARVARTTPRPAPVLGVGVLGASVVAYPGLLSLAAAEVGGLVGTTLGAAGHVLPLTLVQLVPVLAGRQVVGRPRRGWGLTVVAVAVVGVVLTGLGLAGAPGAGVMLPVATVLWFASFLLAPVVTWTAVRGTAGETRRRAVVAALAALVPVVVLVWCVALGALPRTLGPDASVTALMVGFSVGTASCGLLTLRACGPAGSTVLRTRVVIGTLHAVLGVLALIVGTLAALTVAALGVASSWALLLGAAAALAAGLPWLRLHVWARRVVDPAAELRHELSALGQVAPGHHRQAALHVLRRVVGDPDLQVTYGAPSGAQDDSGAQDRSEAGAVCLARHADGAPAATAHAASAAGTVRLRALGDCADALRPAVLEAQVAHESRRADLAAEAERRQVAQDLHDGLQGRLLGLALHLQLGARSLDDPGAALLAEETVESLRAAVDDVRALGGGRVPDLLAREGLRPALTALFRPVADRVELDLPTEPLGAATEATAYFVVGEAVSNALKHAGADRIRVAVIRVAVATDGHHRVSVCVSDDGCGGADPRLGSGLRGIAERVDAAGGVLVVHDLRPGTAVEAVLPCGS